MPLRAEAMDLAKNDLEPLRLKVQLVAHPVGVAVVLAERFRIGPFPGRQTWEKE